MVESTNSYMDAGKMVRRAHDRGETLETYDPHQLIRDVVALLRDRGLNPDAEGRLGMAVGGAGMLLRSLGIAPFGDYMTDSHDPEMR